MVARLRSPLVLFCAAAGPRRGFGHLVRCGVLADALGVRRELALRGSIATVHAALRLGWTVHRAAPGQLIASLLPDLVVIDDPSARHVAEWIAVARRLGIAVATIHDLGLARAGSDLEIDGSLTFPRSLPPAGLQGPAFAILDPAIARIRSARPVRETNRVLIALGGGANARAMGVRVARRICRAAPGAEIQIAAGFGAHARATVTLPSRCAWLNAPDGLARALAAASVAVVAGGITLYEAAALGTPVVAIPVVDAQRPVIRAFARAGAAIDVSGRDRNRAMARVGVQVARLLAVPHRARALSRHAQRLVDGLGTGRVVRSLRSFLIMPLIERGLHVA